MNASPSACIGLAWGRACLFVIVVVGSMEVNH